MMGHLPSVGEDDYHHLGEFSGQHDGQWRIERADPRIFFITNALLRLIDWGWVQCHFDPPRIIFPAPDRIVLYQIIGWGPAPKHTGVPYADDTGFLLAWPD